ncbi:MAG: NADH-quinone oxidoreductase subunit J, partial [Acidothermaceae bacterium]
KGLHDVNYPQADAGVTNGGGNIYEIAKLLFTRYVFAFEATSALLITAALGAMVLAHRERHEPKRTQRELMQERFRAGVHPTPLPGPGVYARHNAVDTPALLPDGSLSELSVPTAVALISEERGRKPRPSELGESPTAIDQASGKGQSS